MTAAADADLLPPWAPQGKRVVILDDEEIGTARSSGDVFDLLFARGMDAKQRAACFVHGERTAHAYILRTPKREAKR